MAVSVIYNKLLSLASQHRQSFFIYNVVFYEDVNLSIAAEGLDLILKIMQHFNLGSSESIVPEHKKFEFLLSSFLTHLTFSGAETDGFNYDSVHVSV